MATINLSGLWEFALDPEDRGLDEGWHKRRLDDRLVLPGSLQEQGRGDAVGVDTEWTGSMFDAAWYTEPRYAPYREPGNIKVPFWLQPDTHYQGVAWYRRSVEVPPEFLAQRLFVTLERPHWATRLWLDDRPLGERDSLATAHVYDLGAHVEPGSHTLTLRVDNRMVVPVGPNSHSVSDHTQTNWNGVVGRIELQAGSPVWIDLVRVDGDAERRVAHIRLRLGNTTGHAGRASLTLSSPSAPSPVSAEIELAADGAAASLELPLRDDAGLWDEFDPQLHTLSVELAAEANGRRYDDSRTTRFGLRALGVDGTQLTINGRKLFLRGTLECCIFPHTGYPPTDEAPWKRLMRVCREHGLNHLRFHSWCPPEAAFRAADELGMYLQIECSSWANQGASIGEGSPLDDWLYQEGQRIVDAYGDHPSFIMMAYGNEPGGKFEEYLTRWVSYWREAEPHRLHTSGAGWPAIEPNQYHNIPAPRIQAWGQGLGSRINALPPETTTDYSEHVERMGRPIVSHEIGQWCVYPDFDEIPKYNGYLKARNFEIFRDSLAAHHMADQARAFVHASGKLQALCYKEDIESALRTPGFAGFQLLDLHDFPGQGTALVGVLDPFWDSKGYISAAQFRRFCNSTVPLARLPRRYWRTGETLSAAVDVAHFGPAPLADVVAEWRLLDEHESPVAQGALPPADIAVGNGQRLGTVEVELARLAPARKYTLEISLAGTDFANDWDIWLFADTLPDEPSDVLVAARLDDAVAARLAQGGSVLLMPPAADVRAESQIGFSSVFWNTSWTGGQPPHTLGILCAPEHPVFARFPTESHSNWQWWELIHGSAAMMLDALPPALRPLVQPIDTWFENRRLGLLFEASCGGGRIMVCSMDLGSDLDSRPVARQLRHSLLAYMSSDAWQPEHELTLEAIGGLLRDEAHAAGASPAATPPSKSP